MSTDLAIVQDHKGTSGAVVWWSLNGPTDIVELTAAWEQDCLDPKQLPVMPGATVIVQRALQGCLVGKQELRVLRGGRSPAWEVETTWVAADTKTGRETVHHKKDGWFSLPGDQVTDLVSEAHTDDGTKLVARVTASIPTHADMLTAPDMSAWLIAFAKDLHAISLRDRGGFYFIPRDQVSRWNEMTALLRSVSCHKFYSLPAMDCAEAVEVLLDVVQAEARELMTELETYLGGTPCTKGLNAWERNLKALNFKVQHYADLLGTSLPNFNEHALKLTAGIAAARLMK